MIKSDTLWNYNPHTVAKHKILKRYLQGWAPIILQGTGHNRIVYFDGFAGPGESKDKKLEGSPIIAMRLFAEHSRLPKIWQNNQKKEVVLIMIEMRKDRADYLRNLLPQKFPNLPSWIRWEVRTGKFQDVIGGELDEIEKEGHKLAPAFCFVDPFGWEDIDYGLLARILTYPMSELFVTFMSGFISRFVQDANHDKSISKLFTQQQIASITTTNGNKGEMIREAFILNLEEAARKIGVYDSLYNLSFEAKDRSNNTLYHLVYVTKSESGMEVMKDSMFHLSEGDDFVFSDFAFDPGQVKMVDYSKDKYWIGECSVEIHKDLIGKTMKVREVRHYVYFNTKKWIFQKVILQDLEEAGKIIYHGYRATKRKTYDNDAEVTFI